MTNIETLHEFVNSLPQDVVPARGNRVLVAVHDCDSNNTVVVHNRSTPAETKHKQDINHIAHLAASSPRPAIPGHNAIITVATSWNTAINDLMNKVAITAIGTALTAFLLNPALLYAAIGLIIGASAGAILHLLIHLHRHKRHVRMGEDISISVAKLLDDNPQPFPNRLEVAHAQYTVVLNNTGLQA